MTFLCNLIFFFDLVSVILDLTDKSKSGPYRSKASEYMDRAVEVLLNSNVVKSDP